jgi:MFS family permease
VEVQENTLKNIIVEIVFTVLKAIRKYKKRFFLAFFLMFSQAFFFNLVYYKFPATLEKEFKLGQDQIGLYMLPLALSSFLSTLVIGPLFDKIGRRQLLLVTCNFTAIIQTLYQGFCSW